MTSPAGTYVTSYDAGSKPFKHDSTRGKWSSDWDFYLACISHAFGLANFSVLPVLIMMHGGVFFIVPYIISLCLFTLPIFFIQSFLGQFSSTGFISVYRISPLFKGIGYVILILNIISACINSVTAAYVLTYFFASFSIDLPWMSCNHTWNSENCSEVFRNVTGTSMDFYDMSWSTAEYFQERILNFDVDHYGEIEGTAIAWPIFGSNIVVWIIVGLIVFGGIETVTTYIKYSTIMIFSLLLILFTRLVCLPEAIIDVVEFLTPTIESIQSPAAWFGSPVLSVAAFGTGWGTVLTMSSFNRFKTNITNYMILVNVTLLVAGILAALIVGLAEGYLKDHLHFKSYYYPHPLSYMFIGFPYLFGNMEASQMWSLMFYLMLTLCELNSVIIVMLTTVTSLFDEYEPLRAYKRQICIGLPVALFLPSICFMTNHGYDLFNSALRLCGASQMGICFLELMVVVWIYGRQRFQRDIQFMLGIPFQTWKFYLVRFITPLFILILLMFNVFASIFETWIMSFSYFMVLVGIKILPWIFIPAYIIIKLVSTSGSITARFKRCTRPNDWYPLDSSDRQKYEELLGNSDITHQLVDMTVDDDVE